MMMMMNDVFEFVFLHLSFFSLYKDDGVEPYLHIREEPDARHIPIMMKLWEITEKMDAMQDAVSD